MILQMVSPVTHAVGNCAKRVVVIVSSVLFFRTPVSTINSLGKSDYAAHKHNSQAFILYNKISVYHACNIIRGHWLS